MLGFFFESDVKVLFFFIFVNFLRKNYLKKYFFMFLFDFFNKFLVFFKKCFIILSFLLLMDLLIKVIGYNLKFFFLFKIGFEV